MKLVIANRGYVMDARHGRSVEFHVRLEESWNGSVLQGAVRVSMRQISMVRAQHLIGRDEVSEFVAHEIAMFLELMLAEILGKGILPVMPGEAAAPATPQAPPAEPGKIEP
jgi:hypothetical protein